jgi:hypothetical protein
MPVRELFSRFQTLTRHPGEGWGGINRMGKTYLGGWMLLRMLMEYPLAGRVQRAFEGSRARNFFMRTFD